jgi:acyl-CoA reductase-like NAD-dependent aldehyde dehydrogenase
MSAARVSATRVDGFARVRVLSAFQKISRNHFWSAAMSKPMPPTRITRRKFALGAAVAAGATLLPNDASGQTASATQPQSAAMSKLSPAARAEVEAKIAEIFRKYGDRLTEEQKTDIRKIMAETQDGLEKMRSFDLANGDQPTTVFKIYEPNTENHA